MAGNRTVKKCWDLEKDKAYNLEHGKLMGLHHTTGSCCSACFSLGSVIVRPVADWTVCNNVANSLANYLSTTYPFQPNISPKGDQMLFNLSTIV